MMSTTVKTGSWRPWLLLVLVVALAQRAILWLAYPPGIYHDTGGYRRLAETILGGWQFYDGTRAPGYPLWLAWLGPDPWVVLSQLFLGLAITLCFFWLGWQAARSPAFGAATALAHTLNLGQLFFEANLLSETLTTFWLALLLVCMALALRWQARRRWLAALAAGLLAAFAGLTRSLFIFLPFWVGLFLSFSPSQSTAPPSGTILNSIEKLLAKLRLGQKVSSISVHLRESAVFHISFDWRPLLSASLAGVVLIGAWVNFLYQKYGVLSVTTMGGLHMVQHTGQWFELLPDEDAAVRDAFLPYRAAQIAKTGSAANAIWNAQPDLQKVTGLGLFQLSDLLARLSLRLIAQHPDRYLLSVLDGWQLFWRAPVYWQPEVVSSPVLRAALEGLVAVERLLLVGCNLVFLVTSAISLFSRRWRARMGVTPWWAFLLLTVWLTSIIQTLPDHGDNPRFLIPLQSWVIIWVVWLAWRLWTYIQLRKEKYF